MDDVSITGWSPLPYVAVSDVEHCGEGGTIKVPVLLRNSSGVRTDLTVQCSVDGTLLETLRLFNVDPGEVRQSAFTMECTPDEAHSVTCSVVGVASADPESVVFARSADASVTCSLGCCRELFAARPSSPRDPGAPEGTRIIFGTHPMEIIRGEGDRFFLRGSCASPGSFVVDDEVLVGSHVFSGTSGPKGVGYSSGVPIETLMNSVSAIDVTDYLPWGKGTVNFSLGDSSAPGYGNTAVYLLKTSGGSVTGVGDTPEVRQGTFALTLGPNPSHGSVRILFEGLEGNRAAVSVFDIAGRRVRDFGSLILPTTEINWEGTDDNGRPLASGIYFVVATSETRSTTRKLVILQ